MTRKYLAVTSRGFPRFTPQLRGLPRNGCGMKCRSGGGLGVALLLEPGDDPGLAVADLTAATSEPEAGWPLAAVAPLVDGVSCNAEVVGEFGDGHQPVVQGCSSRGSAHRGIGVVTGEVGAGKSVAARAAVSRLDASRHAIVYLPNPAIGGRGLHVHLVYALDGVPRFHTAPLIAQTQDLLAAENDEKNRIVVLICDEAHLLSNEQLEQLRLLTSSDMDARSPLALVLLGRSVAAPTTGYPGRSG